MALPQIRVSRGLLKKCFVAEALEPRRLLSGTPPPTASDWISLDLRNYTPLITGVENDSNQNGINDTLETQLLNTFDPMIAPPGVDNTTPISVSEFLSRSGVYAATASTPGSNPANALILD